MKLDLKQILGLPTGKDCPRLLIECLAEVFGTFIIVFFGCGSALAPALKVSLKIFLILA